MNLKHLLLGMAFLTMLSLQPSFAALQAPLPEFQSPQQLAARKQIAQPTFHSASGREGAFYTGKPFDAQREGYLFQYRSYDPELNRWASLDPSGFPDGANNQIYAAVPTGELDDTGCSKTAVVTGTPQTGTTGRVAITVSMAPKQNGDISGIMKTTFKVNNLTGSSTTQYGWLVQHIHIDYNVAYDGTNAAYQVPNIGTAQYPYDYWEAWRVNNDGGVWATDSSGNIFASAEDTYQTPTFPDNTHGYYNVTGTMTVFSLGAVGSSGPLTWGNVAFAGSLPSTATEPSWWAGNAYYNHNLKMSWE